MNNRQRKQIERMVKEVITAKMLAANVHEIKQEVLNGKWGDDEVILPPFFTVAELTSNENWQYDKGITRHMVAAMAGRTLHHVILRTLNVATIEQAGLTQLELMKMLSLTDDVEIAAVDILHPVVH